MSPTNRSTGWPAEPGASEEHRGKCVWWNPLNESFRTWAHLQENKIICIPPLEPTPGPRPLGSGYTTRLTLGGSLDSTEQLWHRRDMMETNVVMVNVAAGPNKHINTSGKGPETRQQLSLNNYSSLMLVQTVAAATGNTRRNNLIWSDILLTKINPQLKGKKLSSIYCPVFPAPSFSLKFVLLWCLFSQPWRCVYPWNGDGVYLTLTCATIPAELRPRALQVEGLHRDAVWSVGQQVLQPGVVSVSRNWSLRITASVNFIISPRNKRMLLLSWQQLLWNICWCCIIKTALFSGW